MSAACAATGMAWLRVESRQGIVRRNGIKSVPQGWKSSPMSVEVEKVPFSKPDQGWLLSYPRVC